MLFADAAACIQLFYNDRELKPTPHALNGLVYDEMTLGELYIGPGETLYGYDLAIAPDYWPKKYNEEKEMLELMPEFKALEAEPEKHVMPEVERVTDPVLYARARKVYTTELDCSGRVAFKGMIEPETASKVASENWPGIAEKGWLPGRWNEDRHAFLGSAGGQEYVVAKAD